MCPEAMESRDGTRACVIAEYGLGRCHGSCTVSSCAFSRTYAVTRNPIMGHGVKRYGMKIIRYATRIAFTGDR
jgi:hypothetical protein